MEKEEEKTNPIKKGYENVVDSLKTDNMKQKEEDEKGIWTKTKEKATEVKDKVHDYFEKE
jgi:hypothetical protein